MAKAELRAFAMMVMALFVPSPVSAGTDRIGGSALGAGLQAGTAVVRSPQDPANVQSWLSMRLLLELPLAGVLGLGFSAGYRFADESNPATGVLYRGHNGLEVASYLLLRSALHADRPAARAGIAMGGSASFDVYNRTELLFFYPSLSAEPYLELPMAGPPRHTLSFGLPCRLDFRRDLEVSASIGLALSWRWYPKWKMERV
jgi:hypothetical protein